MVVGEGVASCLPHMHTGADYSATLALVYSQFSASGLYAISPAIPITF